MADSISQMLARDNQTVANALERYTAADLREAEQKFGVEITDWHYRRDGSVAMTVEGSLSSQQTRELAAFFGDEVAITFARDGGTASDSTSSSDGGGGTVTTASSGGGGTPGPVSTSPGGSTGGTTPTETAGDYRQVPGGGELWIVGRTHFMVYKVPGSNIPLAWKVEDAERLEAITGTRTPKADRAITWDQFRAMSPWQAGLSAELQVTDDDPWQVFTSKFNEQAELRPWLRDPTVMATMGMAYLEGRAPTTDELSRTDWWDDHTAAERAWMESAATAGDAEIASRKEDAAREVRDTLAAAGMANPPESVVEFVALQRLTGAWSKDYTDEQMRRLVDPWAPGETDRGLIFALRSSTDGAVADARAVSAGEPAVRERILELFAERGVGVNSARLQRMVDGIVSGSTDFAHIRYQADIQASQTPGARVGGFDATREGEEEVRQMAARWLGPVVGKMPDREVAEWAGRIRNDPDATDELLAMLRQQRLALLPGYENENLTYEDIVSPVRNLASNVWGQPVDDEAMLVDLANTRDYTEMAKRLRKAGLDRGIAKVAQDALSGLDSTGLGERVQRSAI